MLENSDLNQSNQYVIVSSYKLIDYMKQNSIHDQSVVQRYPTILNYYQTMDCIDVVREFLDGYEIYFSEYLQKLPMNYYMVLLRNCGMTEREFRKYNPELFHPDLMLDIEGGLIKIIKTYLLDVEDMSHIDTGGSYEDMMTFYLRRKLGFIKFLGPIIETFRNVKLDEKDVKFRGPFVCEECQKVLGMFDLDTETFFCQNCFQIEYCSKDCRKKHWDEHKMHCYKSQADNFGSKMKGSLAKARNDHNYQTIALLLLCLIVAIFGFYKIWVLMQPQRFKMPTI